MGLRAKDPGSTLWLHPQDQKKEKKGREENTRRTGRESEEWIKGESWESGELGLLAMEMLMHIHHNHSVLCSRGQLGRPDWSPSPGNGQQSGPSVMKSALSARGGSRLRGHHY